MYIIYRLDCIIKLSEYIYSIVLITNNHKSEQKYHKRILISKREEEKQDEDKNSAVKKGKFHCIIYDVFPPFALSLQSIHTTLSTLSPSFRPSQQKGRERD